MAQQQLSGSASAPDVLVSSSPDDSITGISFSPGGPHLCASSFSRSLPVGVWEISPSGATRALSKSPVSDRAVLGCTWSGDGKVVFYGGAEGQLKAWNVATNQVTVLGSHQGAIKDVHFIQELNLVVSSSYDKSISYWDLNRPGQPAARIALPDKPYAVDVKFPYLVSATSSDKQKNLLIYDIKQNPTSPYRVVDSALKLQARCLSIFPDRLGFAVGSIEGRVAITHIHERDAPKNFAFKCHREATPIATQVLPGQPVHGEIYSVNSIAFHPVGTFATAGSDGTFVYWDKDAKQRLKAFPRSNNSITTGTFNREGTIYAYGVGYDWSRGIEAAEKQKVPNGIMLHPVQEAEIAKKKPENRK